MSIVRHCGTWVAPASGGFDSASRRIPIGTQTQRSWWRVLQFDGKSCAGRPQRPAQRGFYP